MNIFDEWAAWLTELVQYLASVLNGLIEALLSLV